MIGVGPGEILICITVANGVYLIRLVTICSVLMITAGVPCVMHGPRWYIILNSPEL